MKFKKNIEVDIHDVDFNGVAKLSSLMRYIQSAAQSQLNSGGMSYDELKKRGRAFILSKIKMEFTSTVRAYDRLTAVSYPCESRGYSWLRCYTLEKDGVTVGRAVSVWALVDVNTHSLVKVSDFELGLDTYEPHSLSLDRFSLPDGLKKLGEYRVCYADLDQNGHMNNTRYPDMLSNFLPLNNKRIHTISLNYFNEAKGGSTLDVFSLEAENNLFYMRTLRKDGKVNVEAQILLSDI